MIWQILLIALGGGIFVFGLFYPKRWHKGWLDGGWPDFDGVDSFIISVVLGIFAFIFMILPWYVMKTLLILGGLTLIYMAGWVFTF
ncbi:hypothetical protein HBP99_04820 [Listeria booriae]|uniref:hypothetical protein n=1 Tax=Listeria booriae TaxID=1552123 RepID=UPI001623E732|nr:hypothetical protein [Listeria booriae]MBC2367945.1 hypothetical protein [Listeria booriae]